MKESIFSDIKKGILLTNFVLNGIGDCKSFDKLDKNQYNELKELIDSVSSKIKQFRS